MRQIIVPMMSGDDGDYHSMFIKIKKNKKNRLLEYFVLKVKNIPNGR